MKHWLPALLLLSLPALSAGQQIGLELNSGLEAGRWIYDKGMSDTADRVHRGYDRTHLSLQVPLSGLIEYQRPRWHLGLGFGRLHIHDDEMIGSEDRRGGRTRYEVSRRGEPVRLLQVFLRGTYVWVNQPRFTLNLLGEVGRFRLETTHPARERMGKGYSQAWALSASFRSPEGRSFFLRIRYFHGHMKARNSPYPGESHDIYSLGLNAGISVSLSP